MFDYFRSDCDIGIMTKRQCQTKDVDPFGGTMSFYWLDPNGVLWTPNYDGTTKLKFNSNTKPWQKMEYIPTGQKGRVERAYITDYITIYDVFNHPDGLQDFVQCRLHLYLGVLQDYEYINNSI